MERKTSRHDSISYGSIAISDKSSVSLDDFPFDSDIGQAENCPNTSHRFAISCQTGCTPWSRHCVLISVSNGPCSSSDHCSAWRNLLTSKRAKRRAGVSSLIVLISSGEGMVDCCRPRRRPRRNRGDGAIDSPSSSWPGISVSRTASLTNSFHGLSMRVNSGQRPTALSRRVLTVLKPVSRQAAR